MCPQVSRQDPTAPGSCLIATWNGQIYKVSSVACDQNSQYVATHTSYGVLCAPLQASSSQTPSSPPQPSPPPINITVAPAPAGTTSPGIQAQASNHPRIAVAPTSEPDACRMSQVQLCTDFEKPVVCHHERPLLCSAAAVPGSEHLQRRLSVNSERADAPGADHPALHQLPDSG